MKQLTKKQKTEIANAIMDNSDFEPSNSRLKHLRPIVRQMLLEMAESVIREMTEDPPQG